LFSLRERRSGGVPLRGRPENAARPRRPRGPSGQRGRRMSGPGELRETRASYSARRAENGVASAAGARCCCTDTAEWSARPTPARRDESQGTGRDAAGRTFERPAAKFCCSRALPLAPLLVLALPPLAGPALVVGRDAGRPPPPHLLLGGAVVVPVGARMGWKH